MADSPKENENKINAVTKAWADDAPGASFYGMTLAEFKASVKPSLDARAEIAQREKEIQDFTNARTDADKISMKTIQNVVKAVRGDKNFGENSSLYEAMGYVRESERRSGLTRKVKPDPAAPEKKP